MKFGMGSKFMELLFCLIINLAYASSIIESQKYKGSSCTSDTQTHSLVKCGVECMANSNCQNFCLDSETDNCTFSNTNVETETKYTTFNEAGVGSFNHTMETCEKMGLSMVIAETEEDLKNIANNVVFSFYYGIVLQNGNYVEAKTQKSLKNYFWYTETSSNMMECVRSLGHEHKWEGIDCSTPLIPVCQTIQVSSSLECNCYTKIQ